MGFFKKHFYKLISAKNNDIRIAANLYQLIVEQARNAVFYTKFDVQDTIDGRFDMVALHLFLVLDRLDSFKNPTEYNGSDRVNAKNIQQELANITIADMDQSVREMGVGDMGVAKRIKAMAQAMWGRFDAYKTTIGSEKFHKAVHKNVYRKNKLKLNVAKKLANYMIIQQNYLQLLTDEQIILGEIKFCVR